MNKTAPRPICQMTIPTNIMSRAKNCASLVETRNLKNTSHTAQHLHAMPRQESDKSPGEKSTAMVGSASGARSLNVSL